MTSTLFAAASAVAFVACGGSGHGPDDAGFDQGAPDLGHDIGVDLGTDLGTDTGSTGTPCSNLPGLYEAGSCSVLSPGVQSFAPRYVLWSDGATKDRYISLPTNSQIDASDMDAWVFPVGTRMWKHFIAGGRRVETRYMEKMREIDTQAVPIQSCQGNEQQLISTNRVQGCWTMRTFIWNAAEDDVTEMFSGARNVLGTNHDIPAAPTDCAECHRARDAGLGFSAVQLNHVNAGVPLTYLISNNILRNVPVGFTAAKANIPGTDTTAIDALGYLHANCGHCHNGVGGVVAYNGMRLWVPVGITDITLTPTYTTTIGLQTIWTHPTTGLTYPRVDPGVAANSAIILRMSSRQTTIQMPRIGTEEIDPVGIAKITNWINAL